NTNSVTGVYTGDFGRHHLQASMRHDNDSQYGGETTGALAYGFDITNRIRATVAGSTAFRAPNFNELYYPGGGNPNLLPEEARNLEAGLRYLNGDTELGATIYRNRITNLISGWPAENIGEAVLEGAHLTAAHRWRQTGVRASLDLQSPLDAITAGRSPERAGGLPGLRSIHPVGRPQPGAG